MRPERSSRSKPAQRRSIGQGGGRSLPRRCAFSGSPAPTIWRRQFATGTPRESRPVVPSRSRENSQGRSGSSGHSVHVRWSRPPDQQARFLATLHLLASQVPEARFEHFYLWAEATLYPGLFEKTHLTVPDGPGLGMDPDPEVLRRYRI